MGRLVHNAYRIHWRVESTRTKTGARFSMMLCRHATEGIILDGSQSQPKSSERQRCYPTVTSTVRLVMSPRGS